MTNVIPFRPRPPVRALEAVTLPWEEGSKMTVEEILTLAARVDAERERIRAGGKLFDLEALRADRHEF